MITGDDALYPIEWFFRVRAGWRAALELDALIVCSTLPEGEREAAITRYIDTTVSSVTQGA